MLVGYNTAKHDPMKLFKMDRHRGEPYVAHVLNIPYDNSQSDNSNDSTSTSNIFKSHSFDQIPRIGKKCKCF